MLLEYHRDVRIEKTLIQKKLHDTERVGFMAVTIVSLNEVASTIGHLVFYSNRTFKLGDTYYFTLCI